MEQWLLVARFIIVTTVLLFTLSIIPYWVLLSINVEVEVEDDIRV